MTRDQAIAELEELRAELEAAGQAVGGAYYPIGADLAPELRIPWPYGRRVSIRWMAGVWRVEVEEQYPSGVWLSRHGAELATLAECMAWLAGRE